MTKNSQIELTKKILSNFRIDSHVINLYETSSDKISKQLDHGLRDYCNMTQDYDNLFLEPKFKVNTNTVYKVTDMFLCDYIFIKLPDSDHQIFIAGPYTQTQVTKEMLLKVGEKNHISPQKFGQLESFYKTIPYINDEWVAAVINGLANEIWGKDNYKVANIKFNSTYDPELIPDSGNIEDEESSEYMELLKRRFEYENLLINAVSHGATEKAVEIISKVKKADIPQLYADPLRSFKNHNIILNSLLRKSVELSGVNPLQIRQTTLRFAREIEELTSADDAIALQNQIVEEYCNLVNQYSMKKHSNLIHSVITRINLDIASDLTLNAQAKLLNINPSYLSSLFKKETGQTLTTYVNQKRIEHACGLLRNTSLQVQTIAQQCGIFDVNYFTKMFKRYTGMTPKEYREKSSIK